MGRLRAVTGRLARFLPKTSPWLAWKRERNRALARDSFVPYADDPDMVDPEWPDRKLRDRLRRMWNADIDPLYARACRAAAQIASQRGLGEPKTLAVIVNLTLNEAIVTNQYGIAAVVHLAGRRAVQRGDSPTIQTDIVEWLGEQDRG